MPSQEFVVMVWVSVVGFFLTITVVVGGFYLMMKEARKINAVQAAIFLHMRQQFADFDQKLAEFLRGQR